MVEGVGDCDHWNWQVIVMEVVSGDGSDGSDG